jgi:hypothetical protein
VTDKGYDSEKANSFRPVRKRQKTKTCGKYRKQLDLIFDKIEIQSNKYNEDKVLCCQKEVWRVLRTRKFHNQIK